MWNYANAPTTVLQKVKLLQEVANDHKVSLPAAALQFPLANSIVSSVIPGPRSTEEFNQILSWFSEEIPEEFWMDLKSKTLIDKRAPTPNP